MVICEKYLTTKEHYHNKTLKLKKERKHNYIYTDDKKNKIKQLTKLEMKVHFTHVSNYNIVNQYFY